MHFSGCSWSRAWITALFEKPHPPMIGNAPNYAELHPVFSRRSPCHDPSGAPALCK